MTENNEDKPTGVYVEIPVSKELLSKIEKFKEDWYKHYKKISKEKTPTYDGSGKQVIKKRPDGKDYIEDAWMTDRLNKHFPGWSWEAAAPLHFLGSEWVVAQGHLCILDERLLAFGINPPLRKYYGVDAVRIQYKKDAPHTPDNIVDVGDNCQSANTGAKKRAINRLCSIGDDIYGKRVEEEGAGSLEEIMAGGEVTASISTDTQKKAFDMFLAQRKIPVSRACQILGIKTIYEVTDYSEALNKIQKELD